MADYTKLGSKKFAVLEFNHITSQATGQIKAQHILDPNDFDFDNPAENGMLLVPVDAQIDRERMGYITKPADEEAIAWLHFSIEKLYDERRQRLDEYAVYPETDDMDYDFLGYDYFRPRLYGLTLGDTFTTNAVIYESSKATAKEANDELEALIKTNDVYGVPDPTGYIRITQTDPGVGTLLKVSKYSTLPDYTNPGIKFSVVRVH